MFYVILGWPSIFYKIKPRIIRNFINIPTTITIEIYSTIKK